jgi:hypothetical protein
MSFSGLVFRSMWKWQQKLGMVGCEMNQKVRALPMILNVKVLNYITPAKQSI